MGGPSWSAYQNPGDHPLEDAARAELLAAQLECVVIWSRPDAWPIGVCHWFVWRDGRFWVTAGAGRPRIEALRAEPRSTVVVSNAGALPGPPRSLTARTLATVHDDGAVLNAWFAHDLAAKGQGEGTSRAARFEAMLRETPRVVVELQPVSWTSYDAARMEAGLSAERRPDAGTGPVSR
jgi:hypothetical protein